MQANHRALRGVGGFLFYSRLRGVEMKFLERWINNMKGNGKKELSLGRNDVCWCGSGKKYKKCHLDQDETKRKKKTM